MTTKEEDVGALVNVAVPEEHLGAVYSLLGNLSSGQNGPSPAPPTEDAEWWNEKRLRKAYDQSSPAQQAILKAMAAGKGSWVSVSDIVDQLPKGADWNTMAGALGAFGRRIKTRYKAKERPFEIRYNHDLGENEYLMSSSVARVINSF